MKYDFVRFQGRGGFAEVNVVCDSNCKQYAKKTYKPAQHMLDNSDNEQLRKRFIREVKYQQQLNHPNIVKVVDDLLSENPPSFIMPLALCTLRDEIYSTERFQKDELNKILFDILSGLEYMHSKGLVHRDVKPANILKFEDKNEAYYALADLGLVSKLDNNSSTLTVTNAIGGTENYSAPELTKSLKAATAQSDIYSFGAILHDIFGKNISRIPYTELNLNNPVGPIIEKCTKLQPKRRYANVTLLREELYQVLINSEIEFISSNEKAVVDLLMSKDKLNDDEWDQVFMQLDDNLNSDDSIENIIAVITLKHLDNLLENSPELYSAMGKYFAEHIMSQDFVFEYCDVLANKAENFYENSGIELKSLITLALLKLGTSHNRFYVEKKVKRMLSSNISDELARRIKMEVEVMELDFKKLVLHLCESIEVDPEFLNPILNELL